MLEDLDAWPWRHTVYLPSGRLSADTVCIIQDPDHLAPGEDLPALVRRRGYTAGLSIADLDSIQENARLQGRVRLGDQIAAIEHYLEQDAFLAFDGRGGSD